ncbi:hypothetical protein ACFQ9X_13060 [Catenulispora yoronensis]
MIGRPADRVRRRGSPTCRLALPTHPAAHPSGTASWSCRIRHFALGRQDGGHDDRGRRRHRTPVGPAAAERVLELTQVARPADLPSILGALTATELAAGVARLGRRLPEPVVDHVIEHGPPGARRALAWQLRLPLRHAGVLGYDTARRKLLRLADPEVDRALFGRLDQAGVNWVRAAILRDRTGSDGAAIVPPDLRARLVDFLGTAVLPRSPEDLANTDTGDPDFELLRVLAGARDPGLAIPAARILGLPGPLPARAAGWRDQTWVHGWDRPGVGSRAWSVDWEEILELAAGHRDVAGDRGRFLGQVKGSTRRPRARTSPRTSGSGCWPATRRPRGTPERPTSAPCGGSRRR